MSDESKVLNIDANISFKDILFNIRLAGYGYIWFSYGGSGDSGSIDELILIPKEAAEQDEDGRISLKDDKYPFSIDQKHVLSSEVTHKIEESIHDNILSDAPDWYNNDGGGGEGYICTEDGEYICDHFVNIVEREESEIRGKFF